MTNELKQALLDYFKDNEDGFIEAIEELDSWNGYLNDERWYDMNDFNELCGQRDAIDFLGMAYFGRDEDDFMVDERGNKCYQGFNPFREYFSFDGYGNLVSSNYKNYSSFLNEYFVQEFINEMDNLYLSESLKNDICEIIEAETA